MKGTCKTGPLSSLEDWNEANVGLVPGVQPGWNTLSQDVLTELRQALWQEQHGLCVYCGRRITLGARAGGTLMNHIEHFRPRSTYAELTFNYDNLLLSCGYGYSVDTAPLDSTCGVAKDDQFDEASFLYPEVGECRARFHFTEAGGIEAAEGDVSANTMIVVLNLLDRQLIELRRRAWGTLLDMALDEGIAPDPTSLAASNALAAYEIPDAEGALYAFSHVVSYLARRA
jgi:uncharacterized protein (TIGR02646 family)